MSTERSRYRVIPFGCKVSRIEARSIARSLEEDGAVPAGPEEAADLVVVHGCTVTARADRDVRKEIRRLRRENPRARLVVSGCFSRRDGDGVLRMSEVDAVDPAIGAGWALDAPDLEPGRTRAFLKIQDGCFRRCSYCVIPLVRGPERSAAEEEVVAAVRELGAAGVAEVVLTGVHLAAYRPAPKRGLLDLLERLERDPPRCRVRLSSLEPMEAGQELIDFVAASRTVVPHLHLPLQSGSDQVLRRMKRGITRSRYAEMVERAARMNDRIHLATDVIVGFPGETEQEFEESRELLCALPIASLHVFPFSPRSGTVAEALHRTAPVSPARRQERAEILRAIGRRKEADFVRRALGTEADVVALRGGRGLTDHYLEVELASGEEGLPRPGDRFIARLEPGRERGSLCAVPLQGLQARDPS